MEEKFEGDRNWEFLKGNWKYLLNLISISNLFKRNRKDLKKKWEIFERKMGKFYLTGAEVG